MADLIFLTVDGAASSAPNNALANHQVAIMDDKYAEAAGSEPASTAQFETVVTLKGTSSAELNRVRQARARRHSDYKPTNIYVTRGERLQISYAFVTGKVSAVIGVPEIDTPVVIDLIDGDNIIDAPQSGLLSFIYQTPGGTGLAFIKGSFSYVPAFTLHETSDAQWLAQMQQHKNAPVVVLTSERAMIVVRYDSAKNYLTGSVNRLMLYYDDVIRSQDAISGIAGTDDTEWAIDPNKNFYVEADSGYMFADHGHMGFHGEKALRRLLSSDTATGWGPWHESGHQRQLSSMTWANMTEVTVNVYSLATQERLECHASGLDSVYPSIKKYLNSPHRIFHNLPEHSQRVAMFWQLHLTFGPAFYPQLHQRYRLMQDPPRLDIGKDQRFMVETSLLTHTNLSVFFDRWGIYPTPETLRQISDLPTLEKPIWDTDATTTYTLPLPIPSYIPALAHLRSSARLGGRDGKHGFYIDKQLYLTHHFEIVVNGVVVASADHDIRQNCEVLFEGNVAHVNSNTQVGFFDRTSIVAVFGNFKPLLAGAGSGSDLSPITDLFTDERCVELSPGFTVSHFNDLYFLWSLFPDEQGVAIRLLRRAQRLYLESMVKSFAVSLNRVVVTFVNQSFKDNEYALMDGSSTLSTLENGQASGSQLVGNVWTWVGSLSPTSEVALTAVAVAEPSYTLFSKSPLQDDIHSEVRTLFTDEAMTQLAAFVDQPVLNDLDEKINGNFQINVINRATYRLYLNTAQALLLKRTILRIVRTANTLQVYFDGDTFVKHNYKLFVNHDYASEITQGKAYYSSVSNGLWTSSRKFENGDNCKVLIEYNGVSHLLYETDIEDSFSALASPDSNVTQCDADDL
ncbi:Uncharacterized protein ALO44_01423 [Pseudomonas syringae pv. tagetis]|uniref:Peptidase M60 domain-containing protein n=2 Tax=Pseudomonas syringae pv. tagetis TaxID=129140 RepID=A0A0Q0H161_9PSED|nr:Uncharacterized protein ALO44_01423 [Pseudomonas syringae pv. tagetis]RMW19491.1 hypothetical protein ALO98_01111 [Pseudomonas syringae pv. tagetis]